MLKQFLSVLILVFFFTTSYAQPKTAAAWYKSGIQLRNENNYPEALNAFNKAVSLNKKFDSAYVEIGNLYLKSGDEGSGIVNFKNALALNPRYTDALIGMGKVYRDYRKNLDSALIYYHAAVNTSTTSVEIYYSLAWTYNAKAKYDSAIIYAIKALEVNNTYKPAYGELGHAYNASKKYAEAIEQFKKRLAISPVDVVYLYTAFCYIELKNKAGAMEQYEILLKMNEKMAGALKKKIDAMQ